jgi:hypothetical protein
MTGAGVVLAVALLSLATYRFAGKAKEGMHAGIEGIENLASKGKESLFGKSPTQTHFEELGTPGMIDRAKATFGFGRHEALQKVRDALGVESGKPIGPEDFSRLEELIRLDQYSHSEGFWSNLKQKFAGPEDITKKFKSVFGIDKGDKLGELFRQLGSDKDASRRLWEALGVEDKSVGQETLLKMKELLGVEGDKPIGQETLQKLLEILGYDGHEPTFWEKVKSQVESKMPHLGSSETTKNGDTLAEKAKQQIKDIGDKVKDTLSGKDKMERLLEEAKQRAAESKELLEKAYAEEKKVKAAGGH